MKKRIESVDAKNSIILSTKEVFWYGISGGKVLFCERQADVDAGLIKIWLLREDNKQMSLLMKIGKGDLFRVKVFFPEDGIFVLRKLGEDIAFCCETDEEVALSKWHVWTKTEDGYRECNDLFYKDFKEIREIRYAPESGTLWVFGYDWDDIDQSCFYQQIPNGYEMAASSGGTIFPMDCFKAKLPVFEAAQHFIGKRAEECFSNFSAFAKGF